MIGQTINNRYKITARLGKGAMGTVYRATDTQSGHDVALKVISSELAIEPEILERFKREGESLRKLKHPNIVGFVDAFQYDETYVIVMEFVSGGSLFDMLKKGPLSIEYARQIALDLCDALIRAHRLTIVHRDLKPENILIDQDGTPKLADFGVARLNEGTRMTRSGTQVGTPYYMAPEAWEGTNLDAQADIWSLGVVLFEMLTGQVPFGGETGPAVMNKVFTSQPPDLQRMRAETPSGLVKIVNRMLMRDKQRRYQTMREVGVDLERGVVGRNIGQERIPTYNTMRRLGIGIIFLLLTVAGALGLNNLIRNVTVSKSGPSSESDITTQIKISTNSSDATGSPELAKTTKIQPASEVIPGASIIFQDTFDNFAESIKSWSQFGNIDFRDGMVNLSGTSAGMSRRSGLSIGRGILVLFKGTSGADGNIVYFDNAINGGKMIGIAAAIDPGFIISLADNDKWMGGQVLDGQMKFQFNHWYYGIIEIRKGGEFFMKVIDAEAPQSFVEKSLPMGMQEWGYSRWYGSVTVNGTNTGTIQIDSYAEYVLP